jgi:hypothetical protein
MGKPCPSVSRDRLVPLLPRSVGLRPVFSPAQRCLGHRPVHRLPFPVEAPAGIKLDQACLPELTKHPSFAPGLETLMHGAACPYASRECLPLVTCPQHVEDRIHGLSGWHSGPSALRVRSLLWQKGLDALPEFIWDAPLLVNRCVPCHCPPPLALADTQHILCQLSDRGTTPSNCDEVVGCLKKGEPIGHPWDVTSTSRP